MLFEANDNNRRDAADRTASRPMIGDLKKLRVIGEAVKELADLMQRIGFRVLSRVALAVVGRTRSGEGAATGSYTAATG